MKKVALITGASSGIGKELTKIHASKGRDLIIVARSEDKLTALANEMQQKYNISVHVIIKDLTRLESAKEIYNEVKGMNIEVDYLINNAGFGGRGYFHERAWEKDLAMINLNITALTSLTRHFLPDMVARKRGRILNTSSSAALLPGPLQAVYYASKAYVTSFSNALAQELKQHNISVTALMPGATETEFAKVSGMDKTALFHKTFSPKVVAEAGYEAMMKGKLNVITGMNFGQKIMMKFIPFTPKKILLKQVFSMQQEQ